MWSRNPCADYGDKNCRTETITGTAKSNWVYGEKGDSNKYKLDCMRCIQGSKGRNNYDEIFGLYWI